jgi:hypothetical protein
MIPNLEVAKVEIPLWFGLAVGLVWFGPSGGFVVVGLIGLTWFEDMGPMP